MIGRSTKLFLEILASLIVVVALGAAVLAWRLSAGPVSISFLTPILEAAVTSRSGMSLDIDNTQLVWRSIRRRVDIQASGVHVQGPDGRQIASIPEINMTLSARALLKGLVAPTHLEVTGAKLTLTRAADGGFGLLAPEGDADDFAPVLPFLIEDLTSPPSPDRGIGYLQQVRITEAAITLVDRKTGRVWRAPQAQVILLRDAAGLRTEGSMVIEAAGTQARLTVSGSFSTAERRVDITATAASFDPGALAIFDQRLSRASALDALVSGIARLRLDGSGHLIGLDFDLTGGAGTVNDPEFFPETVQIRGARLRGSVTEEFSRIDLHEVKIDLGGPAVDLTGQISGLGDRPRVRANGTVRNVPVDSLRQLWPRGVGENTRRWITENLSSGVITETRFDIGLAAKDGSLESLAANHLEGTLQVSGVDVNYLSPMPRVRGVSATGKLGLTRMDLAISSGGIGELRVAEGAIAITGLDLKDQDIDIRLFIQGPVRNALNLVDSPPLGFMKKIGQKPTDFGGSAAVQLHLAFPLLNELTLDDIKVTANANISGFTNSQAALGQDVTDGNVLLHVDGSGMDATGNIIFAGVPADLSLRRNFIESADPIGQIKLKGTVDDAARSRLGLDLGTRIQGPVDIDLTWIEERKDRGKLALDLGLAPALVELPELGWRKEAGVPASAQIRLSLAEERLSELSSFQISSPVFSAQGKGTFTADGKTFQRLEIEHIKGDYTDARASYERTADGVAVELTGKSFDAGPLIRKRSGAGGGEPSLSVRASLARVYFAVNRYIDNVTLEAQRNPDGWQTVSLQALAGGEGPARNLGISLRTEGNRQLLDASAADAGAVLRAIGATPNIVGGQLQITGATDPARPGRPLVGTVRMGDFRVVKAPLLARILSVALLTGIADSLRGDGIGFTRLAGDFVFNDPALEFRNLRAHGAALGITANGMIDITTEMVDLDGTIVPAYAINSLLGRVPLVGEALVGGRGGGLFAANYSVTGPASDAKVSINPISTIAPGFLRNLFGGGGGRSPSGTEPLPEPGGSTTGDAPKRP